MQPHSVLFHQSNHVNYILSESLYAQRALIIVLQSGMVGVTFVPKRAHMSPKCPFYSGEKEAPSAGKATPSCVDISRMAEGEGAGFRMLLNTMIGCKGYSFRSLCLLLVDILLIMRPW